MHKLRTVRGQIFEFQDFVDRDSWVRTSPISANPETSFLRRGSNAPREGLASFLSILHDFPHLLQSHFDPIAVLL
jgi:hypothetical protein